MTHSTGENASTVSSVPVILPESAALSILKAVEGLRYGQVTVIVQDGRVLQIDRTERVRLTKPVGSAGDDIEAGRPPAS